MHMRYICYNGYSNYKPRPSAKELLDKFPKRASKHQCQRKKR